VRCLPMCFAVEDGPPSAVILDQALSDGESSPLCDCLEVRNIPYVLYSGYRKHNGATDKADPCPNLHRLNTS
jgi:hypothetical protein